MTTTTIQINNSIKHRLEGYKMHGKESYNEVLERLLEDVSRLSAETHVEIQAARKEIASGKFKTHEQLGKEMGF